MCKIIVLTNTAKMNKLDLNRAIKYSPSILQQDDGFGYTCINKKDQSKYTERFVNPKSVKSTLDQKIKVRGIQHEFSKPAKRGQEGTKPDETVGGLLLHGRISTNDKNLLNTHPINKYGWSLIHNGVVEDSGPVYTMKTTNDTEHCLERLSLGIDQVEAHISGYYALGALDPENNLHIVKDSIAPLFCSYIQNLDSYIFASAEYLIQDFCEELAYDYDTISEVKNNIYLVFDVKGNLIHSQEINPKGSSAYADSWRDDSLGAVASLVPKSGTTAAGLDTPLDYYLDEIEHYSDSSYVFIHNRTKQELTRAEFMKLETSVMVKDYTVVRPDGTICDPKEYWTDKLYAG